MDLFLLTMTNLLIHWVVWSNGLIMPAGCYLYKLSLKCSLCFLRQNIWVQFYVIGLTLEFANQFEAILVQVHETLSEKYNSCVMCIGLWLAHIGLLVSAGYTVVSL